MKDNAIFINCPFDDGYINGWDVRPHLDKPETLIMEFRRWIVVNRDLPATLKSFSSSDIWYKYNDFYADHICILYKKLALGTQRPKQTMACRCQYYKLNQTLMNHNIEEIEKDIEVVKDFMDMI